MKVGVERNRSWNAKRYLLSINAHGKYFTQIIATATVIRWSIRACEYDILLSISAFSTREHSFSRPMTTTTTAMTMATMILMSLVVSLFAVQFSRRSHFSSFLRHLRGGFSRRAFQSAPFHAACEFGRKKSPPGDVARKVSQRKSRAANCKRSNA